MSWRPLERVPDPLQLGLCDAVLATVLDRDTGRGIRREGDGSLLVPLPDGQDLRVSLRVTSETAVRTGPRQAIRYALEGRAVAGTVGYGLAARATLDVKTRAFVDVACDILWRS